MTLQTISIVGIMNEKHWVNKGEYCNRFFHPSVLSYRSYRRGKSRCRVCGAKVGDSVYKYQSYQDQVTEIFFRRNLLLDRLMEKKESL